MAPEYVSTYVCETSIESGCALDFTPQLVHLSKLSRVPLHHSAWGPLTRGGGVGGVRSALCYNLSGARGAV